MSNLSCPPKTQTVSTGELDREITRLRACESALRELMFFVEDDYYTLKSTSADGERFDTAFAAAKKALSK